MKLDKIEIVVIILAFPIFFLTSLLLIPIHFIGDFLNMYDSFLNNGPEFDNYD